MQGESEKDMKVITAVKKYLKTDREIFLECVKDGTLVIISKDKDFYLEFGSVIAETEVKNIEIEDPEGFKGAVTIYI